MIREITVTLKFIDRKGIVPVKGLDQFREWITRTLNDDLFTELLIENPSVFVVTISQREISK